MRRAALLLIVVCLLALTGCGFVIATAFFTSCGPFPFDPAKDCGGGWVRHLLPEELRRPVLVPPGIEQSAQGMQQAIYYIACPKLGDWSAETKWPEDCLPLKAKLGIEP